MPVRWLVGRRAVLLILVTLATPLTLSVSPQAFAAHVSCGQTLMANTRLDGNLFCPGSVGLTIGADNITLDLNGHTIRGDDTNQGVYNLMNKIRIRNGVIRDFAAGVVIAGVGNRVNGLTVLSSGLGIALSNATKTQITNNHVVGGDSGISLQGNFGAGEPRKNKIVNNFVTQVSQTAISITADDGNRIQNNSLVDNNLGIGLADTATGNLIKGNTVSSSPGGSGIFVISDSTNNRLEGNTVDSNHNQGVLLDDAHGSVLKDNEVTNTELFEGILVHNGSTGTLILGNLVNDNGTDGITVAVSDATTEITNNIANGNGSAVGDFGIVASGAVTDGGGNQASGNGDPAQCSGVVCS
jgi:parallel beta-helix repeat protein